MPKAAIYARYSTHQQRDSSIEDQVRRCTELAQRHGYEVPRELVFSDAATSGADEALAKRPGYQELLRAWQAQAFDAIVVDEVSRLARGGEELARLHTRIDRSRVRLISGDGVDSAQPSWSLAFNVIGAVAQQARREVRHRVVRGMVGQLERGYMIADAPFGYRAVVEYSPEGRPRGTRWEIDEAQAAIVRQMYQRRRNGASYHAIARWLNTEGIPPPRKARKEQASFWRQSSVHRLLRNRIYAGEFVWQGSPFARAKAKADGRVLEPRIFPRPHLRLVDDETFRIVTETTPRPHRGGRRHLLAGLLTCGVCFATLTVKKNVGRVDSVYCASCAQAASVKGKSRFRRYTSAQAVTEALRFVMSRIFGEEAQATFRQRLRAKLQGDAAAEMARLKNQLVHAQRACDYLAGLLADLPSRPKSLERQWRRKFAEQMALEAQLEALKAAVPSEQQRAHIERQLLVDPLSLFGELLQAPADVPRVQAVLRRVFPRIALVSKPARYVVLLEIKAVPGAGFAEAAQSDVADPGSVTFRVEVSGSARRPICWSVRQVN